MKDPTPCLLHFLQYFKYIAFFVLQGFSLRILDLVPLAKHTKDLFSRTKLLQEPDLRSYFL